MKQIFSLESEMKRNKLGIYKSFLIFPLLTLLLIYCIKDKVVDSDDKLTDELVQVQVDFQSGVADNRILLKTDNTTCFDAMLSKIVPFAGPVATFTTYLKRGQNTIFLLNEYLDVAQSTAYQDSATIHLGNAEKYFIGIQLSGNKFNIIIKEDPFLYM